jgi:hypothetical protein
MGREPLRSIWITAVVLLVGSLGVSVAPGAAASSSKSPLADYVVIASRLSPIKEIHREDLARIFLRLTNQVDRHPVIPVNYAPEKISMDFMSALTGMSPDELGDHFVELEIRGEGTWPPSVEDPADLVRLLASSEKAISWLPRQQYQHLSERLKRALRIVEVK